MGAMLMPAIPVTGNPVAPEAMLERVDAAVNKKLADAALNAAKVEGRHLRRCAHRPLPQPMHLHPRKAGAEHRQQRESSALGVRVLANGTWGFAATNDRDRSGRGQSRRSRP